MNMIILFDALIGSFPIASVEPLYLTPKLCQMAIFNPNGQSFSGQIKSLTRPSGVILNVLAAFKIFSRRDYGESFEMASEMALIRETHLRRNLRERQSLSEQTLCLDYSHLRLKGMRRHTDLLTEDAVQMKGAKPCYAR